MTNPMQVHESGLRANLDTLSGVRPRWLRAVVRGHLAMSLVPWLHLAFWTLYAFCVRWTLGHWPVAMSDNPTGPLMTWLSQASDVVLLLNLAAAWVWWVLLMARFSAEDHHRVWRAAVIASLGWAATAFLFLCDPVGFVNWFID